MSSTQQPGIPAPGPIGPSPTWAMVVGAIFGGITLIALFGYAAIAGIGYSKFICNSFQLLAGGFALGCGLSAAFLGGGAAAQGTLGNALQTKGYSLAFSLCGGVAVLIIAFFSFSAFAPKNCDKAAALNLQFNGIPTIIQQSSWIFTRCKRKMACRRVFLRLINIHCKFRTTCPAENYKSMNRPRRGGRGRA